MAVPALIATLKEVDIREDCPHRIPFGVVVNRVGIGADRVHVYCDEQNVPVLLEIPDDWRIAEAYSRGKLIVEALPEYRGLFLNLIEKTMNPENYRANVSAKKPWRTSNIVSDAL